MLLSAISKKTQSDQMIRTKQPNIPSTSNSEPVVLFISSQDIDDTDSSKTNFESNDPPPTIMTVRVDLSKFNLNIESTNLGIFMTRYFFDCIWRDSLTPSESINSNSGMSTSKKIYITFYVGTTNQRLIKPQTNLIGKIDADYVILKNGLLISENASYPYSTVFSTNTDSYFENQFTSQQEYFGESGIFIGYADKNGLRALREQQVITVKMVTERNDNYNSPFWYTKFLKGVSIWNESNKIWEIDEPNSERKTFYNKVSLITTSEVGGPYMPLSLYTLEKPIMNSVASFIIKNNLSHVKAKISGRYDILKGDNVKMWISQIGLKNSTSLNDISINTAVFAKDDSTSYSVDVFDYNTQELITEEIINIQKGKNIFSTIGTDNVSKHYTLGYETCRNAPFYFPNGKWEGTEITTTSGYLFPFEKDLDEVVRKIINEQEDYDDMYNNIIIKEDNFLFMDSGSKWEEFGDDNNITIGERALQFDFGNECYVNMLQLIFPKSKEDNQPYEINASLNKTFDGNSKSYVSVKNPIYFSGYQHTKPSGSKTNTDYGKGYKYLNTHTQTTNSLYGCNMPLYKVTNRSLSGNTNFSNINFEVEEPSYIQDYTKPTYTELSDGTKAINITTISGNTYSIDTELSSLNDYSFWTLELKILFSASFDNEISTIILTTSYATLSIENNILALAIGSDYYSSSVSPIIEDQWSIIGIQYDYRDQTIQLYHNGTLLFTIDYVSPTPKPNDVFNTITLGAQTNTNTMYFKTMRSSYILRYPNIDFNTNLQNDIYTLNIEPWLEDKMKYIVDMSGDSFIHTKATPNEINPAYDFVRQEIGPFVKGACIEDVLDTSIYKAIASTSRADWTFTESVNSYFFQDLITFLSSYNGIQSIGGLVFYCKVSADNKYYRITSARQAYFLDPDYIEEIYILSNDIISADSLTNAEFSFYTSFVQYTLTKPIYIWIMKNCYIYLLDGDPTNTSGTTVSPVKEYIVKETYYFSPSYNQYDKDHTTTVGGNSNVLQPSESYNPQKMVVPEFSVSRYFGLTFGSFIGNDNYIHTRGPLNRAKLYGIKLYTQYFDFTSTESGIVTGESSSKPATFNVNVSRGGIISCNVVDSGKEFIDSTYPASPYLSVNGESDSYYDSSTKTWIDRTFYFDESQDYLGGLYSNVRPELNATTTTDTSNIKSYYKGSNKNPLKRSAEFTLKINEKLI